MLRQSLSATWQFKIFGTAPHLNDYIPTTRSVDEHCSEYVANDSRELIAAYSKSKAEQASK